MATRTVKLEGQVVGAPAAATITIAGTQVHTGTIADGATLDTVMELWSKDVTVDDADLTRVSTAAVSVAVTQGILKIGEIYADSLKTDAVDGVNRAGGKRSNILIDSAAPAWPAADVTPQPGGTEESPDWSGWHFEVSAGETITFDLTLDDQNGIPQD